ncbi:MAG TPA: response regulator [Gemmatimonadaceae bacterium]|jgi:two-component system, LytTR family, response regulator|nr:response regulator [Gemmatimonadaceae bacterium]
MAGDIRTAEIRVLIVDDEPLARRGVRLLVARASDFRVVGEAASGAEAVRQIAELSPDVVFLDVQMPEGGGFDVVERIGTARMPFTVFVTAYDEHALRAFEAQAIDYVLKPIDPERFAVTLNRLRALFTKGRPPRRLLLRDGARILAFDEDDIEWIEADGDYVRIHGAEKPTLVRQTLSDLERRLGGSHFVRAHRSAIVNVDRIREATPEGDRGLRLVMRSGRAVRVSRGHRDDVLVRLKVASP